VFREDAGEMKKVFSVKIAAAFFMVSIILFTQVNVASANDAVLGFTPDGVYPVYQSDISMIAEEINIQLVSSTEAKVTCRFVFRNFGDARTVLMGFPAQLNEETSDLNPEEELRVHNFTARDDEGELEVTLADTIPNSPVKKWNGAEKYKKWYCFQVDFDKDEEKTLYHTYEVFFPHDSLGFVEMGYILETGALWKGSLGHSKVIFDLGDIPAYAIESVFPNNFYRLEENRLIWERKDFKPAYNLWVKMNAFHYTEYWIEQCEAAGLTDEIEKIRDKTGLFSISPEEIKENSEVYYEGYKTSVKSDPIRALYIKSALGLPDGNEKPEITECSAEQNGNAWDFTITATDPDGDIVSCTAVIDGIDSYIYDDYERDWVTGYYPKDGQFTFRRYLETEEKTPFSITFIVSDAYGNFDTKTLVLQAEPGKEPMDEETTQVTETKTSENESVEEEQTRSVSHTVQDETDNTGKLNSSGSEKSILRTVIPISAIALFLLISVILYVKMIKKKKEK